jgi:S-ribosylhomocysteine lyase LuxS involved in autoinducer biosynthesis
VKNLENWLVRQTVYALIPLSEMGCRCGHFLANTGAPISLANIK